jgi:PAS domain S-box-containing protein
MNNTEKTILLVDDEALICQDQAAILKREGYNVITALSGKAAIDKFQNGGNIDLVLMDIDLGKGMDGTQVAEIILRDQYLPIIFLSGHTETEIIKKTEKITSYGFVLKGSGENVLSTAIKMAFRLHSLYMENLRKTKSLIDSELRYRRLFESAQDGILILDADQGKIIDANPYLLEVIGYTYNDILGKYLWEISPFQDIAANKAKFLELQKLGYVHYDHLPLMNKSGIIKNVEFVSNVYFVNESKIIQCNIRDIEKRKKHENNREAVLKGKVTMLRELQHRIKNSMAIIISLINLELNRSLDLEIKEAFLRIRNRINSMANLYNMLDSFKNMNEVQLDQYIVKMINELFKSYNAQRDINLDMQLDKILIDVDIALPTGLILNELITNSLKHAFPDDRSGTIRIDLKLINNDVTIDVSDDGVGFPLKSTINNSIGLGMALVQMLTDQIGGSIEHVPIEFGTMFHIKFPLQNKIE